MLTQRVALVFLAEDAPALQLRHQLLHHIVDSLRQKRKRHDEAVRGFLLEPRLPLVGNALRRADKGQAAVSPKPLGQLPHSQPFFLRHPHDVVPAGFAGVVVAQVGGQRRVRVELGGVCSKGNRQAGNGALVVDEAVELESLLLGLLDAIANDDHGGWENVDVLSLSAGGNCTALDVCVHGLCCFHVARCGKDGLGCFAGQLSSWLRLSGLHNHRPSLDRPGNIQRALDLELVAHVVELREDARLLVADEGVVGKAVPQPGHDVVKLLGALVPVRVVHVLVAAKVLGGVWVGRRDNVPRRTAAAEMVERGEPPRHVIGLVVCCRRRGREANLVGHCREGCEQRKGLKGGDGLAAPESLDGHVEDGEVVGHEEGVELGGL
ncbi:hypothetical protein MKX08_002932 [Trichoderma sp. CBMAI-0020]|nr:hypothetical protein MKX08_002932 [Trichoderma sp. CBMAI-0020]